MTEHETMSEEDVKAAVEEICNPLPCGAPGLHRHQCIPAKLLEAEIRRLREVIGRMRGEDVAEKCAYCDKIVSGPRSERPARLAELTYHIALCPSYADIAATLHTRLSVYNDGLGEFDQMLAVSSLAGAAEEIDKVEAAFAEQAAELRKENTTRVYPEPSLQAVFREMVRYRATLGGMATIADIMTLYRLGDKASSSINADATQRLRQFAEELDLDPAIIDSVEWRT